VAARLRGAFGFPAPYGHEPLELESHAGVVCRWEWMGSGLAKMCSRASDACDVEVGVECGLAPLAIRRRRRGIKFVIS